jgi:hypothetical protein
MAFMPQFKLIAGGRAGVATSARCIPLDSEPGRERMPAITREEECNACYVTATVTATRPIFEENSGERRQ